MAKKIFLIYSWKLNDIKFLCGHSSSNHSHILEKTEWKLFTKKEDTPDLKECTLYLSLYVHTDM